MSEPKPTFFESCRKLRRAFRALVGEVFATFLSWRPPCVWTYDDLDDKIETECGRAFCFYDGGAKENDYRFCPGCGRIIEEKEPPECADY